MEDKWTLDGRTQEFKDANKAYRVFLNGQEIDNNLTIAADPHRVLIWVRQSDNAYELEIMYGDVRIEEIRDGE